MDGSFKEVMITDQEDFGALAIATHNLQYDIAADGYISWLDVAINVDGAANGTFVVNRIELRTGESEGNVVDVSGAELANIVGYLFGAYPGTVTVAAAARMRDAAGQAATAVGANTVVWHLFIPFCRYFGDKEFMLPAHKFKKLTLNLNVTVGTAALDTNMITTIKACKFLPSKPPAAGLPNTPYISYINSFRLATGTTAVKQDVTLDGTHLGYLVYAGDITTLGLAVMRLRANEKETIQEWQLYQEVGMQRLRQQAPIAEAQAAYFFLPLITPLQTSGMKKLQLETARGATTTVLDLTVIMRKG